MQAAVTTILFVTVIMLVLNHQNKASVGKEWTERRCNGCGCPAHRNFISYQYDPYHPYRTKGCFGGFGNHKVTHTPDANYPAPTRKPWESGA